MQLKMEHPEVVDKLLALYATTGPERAGFIMPDGEVVELRNIAEDPSKDFLAYPEDTVKYCNEAVASWHTHPGKDGNLSVEDHENFKNWADIDHFIVGSDGLRGYRYVAEKKAIVELEFV